MKLLTFALLMLSVTTMGQSKHNIKVDTAYSLQELLKDKLLSSAVIDTVHTQFEHYKFDSSRFVADTNRYGITANTFLGYVLPNSRNTDLIVNKYGDIYTGEDTFSIQLNNCDSLYAIHVLYEHWKEANRKAELSENLLKMLWLGKIATTQSFWPSKSARLEFKKRLEEYYCKPSLY